MTEKRSRQEYTRYTRYSDAELKSLLRDGEENFIPSAWQDLNREIASRQIPIEALRERADDSEELDDTPPKPAPEGLGGWLAVFQVCVVTQALICLAAAIVLLRYGDIWLPITVGAAVLATFIVGMLLIYARDPFVRTYWIGTMSVMAAVSLISGVTGRVRLIPAVISSLCSAAWAAYWWQSERVRVTFRPGAGTGRFLD